MPAAAACAPDGKSASTDEGDRAPAAAALAAAGTGAASFVRLQVAPQLLQLVAQVLGALRSTLGVLGERAADDPPQLLGERGVHLGDRPRRVPDDRRQGRDAGLVFLDIQLPQIDGLTLARTLGRTMPAVVFVTAYDEYALGAFEVHALDYLLRPSSPLHRPWRQPKVFAGRHADGFEDAAPGRGIRVANADGSNRRLIAEKGRLGAPASPALSPDARQVAFFQAESGPLGDLWLVSTEGGAPRRLTFDSTEAGGPVWTPDGRFIIFYSSRAGSQTLWRISAEGGTPEPVTTGAAQDRDPDISRDGRQLVYSNFRVTFALMLHQPGSGGQRELLQSRLFVGMARFSPDGRRIAFSRQLDDAIQVFTIGVDGQDVRQITEGTGQQNLFSHWPAEAAWLYFFRARPVPSVRKASVLGGDSVEVGSWSMGEPAELDPFGNAAAYLLTKEGRPAATVVRSLAAGHEVVLDAIVQDPRWSPDARTIVGWQSAAESDTPRVVSCAVPQGTCHVIVERGFAPVVAPDGSRILFLSWPAALGKRELWSIRLDGHDPTLVASLRSFGLGATFDVSRRGDVVFPQRQETRSELWRAEFR